MTVHIKNKSFKHTKLDVDELAQTYPLFLYRYSMLMNKYNELDLTPSELMVELDISNSTFYERKKNGINLPDYIEDTVTSRISFPIICVAIFKSQNFVRVN